MPWLYAIIGVGILFTLFAVVMSITQIVEEERMKKARLVLESMPPSYDEDNICDDDYEIP